jgi:hypothetical protein
MTRIAMWSGPRNISTAMMRSWGSRPDTFVSDEPFYAAYLERTGLDHPGAAEVMACHERDPVRVAEYLSGPVPGGKAVWYQKHMAHHMLEGMALEWVGRVRNCVLVREPREMLASLEKVLGEVTPEQTGLPQQIRLLGVIRELEGREPPVVLAADVLRDPEGMLRALCGRLGVGYDERMLRWEAGPKETDGVWGPHWYSRVYSSTGFEVSPPAETTLAAHLEPVLEACRPMFEELAGRRIRAE